MLGAGLPTPPKPRPKVSSSKPESWQNDEGQNDEGRSKKQLYRGMAHHKPHAHFAQDPKVSSIRCIAFPQPLLIFAASRLCVNLSSIHVSACGYQQATLSFRPAEIDPDSGAMSFPVIRNGSRRSSPQGRATCLRQRAASRTFPRCSLSSANFCRRLRSPG